MFPNTCALKFEYSDQCIEGRISRKAGLPQSVGCVESLLLARGPVDHLVSDDGEAAVAEDGRM